MVCLDNVGLVDGVDMCH